MTNAALMQMCAGPDVAGFLEGPLSGRKKALATEGWPAPLLAHARVDGVRRNPHGPGGTK